MSHSSLPDIFRKGSNDSIVFKKIGGSFSLHLSSQSNQKFMTSRAGFAPGDQTMSTLQASKRRSASTISVRPKQSILRDQNNKKPDTARDKMQVSFKYEVSFVTTIVPKQKASLSVLNTSNFPYQTSRKFNNMTIDLQQSESIKNKTDFGLKEMQIVSNNMEETKLIARQTINGFAHFVRDMVEDISHFEDQFESQLKQFYRKMSKMRRQTNDQVKKNRLEIDKVDNQIKVCNSFCFDLDNKSQKMYNECLSSVRDERTSEQKDGLPLDFEEISSIPKTSRGATGDQNKRIKLIQIKKQSNGRKSADWGTLLNRHNSLKVNGYQVDILNLEEC